MDGLRYAIARMFVVAEKHPATASSQNKSCAETRWASSDDKNVHLHAGLHPLDMQPPAFRVVP